MSTTCLSARWVLPVAGEPIENGYVVIDDDRLVFVGGDKPVADEIHDFGESVIMPGLINLHTHLDYTHLGYFECDAPFFEWIGRLVGTSWQWSQDLWRASANEGARRLALSGTSMTFDASLTGNAARAIASTGLRGVVGLELFGVDESKADEVWHAWLKRFADFVGSADEKLLEALSCGRVKLSCAPHTPFTVCPALLKRSFAWTSERLLPLLLHVAESSMESDWIAGSQSQVDEFIARATKCPLPEDMSWKGKGRTPVEHLHEIGVIGPHLLAAHVVQVSQSDLATLSSAGAGVAHCPRSNSRLRNGVAPVPSYLTSGLKFGFGTDSLASNDDLDLLAEARFAWNLQRAVDPAFSSTARQAVFHLTLGAAQAGGVAAEVGSLEAGKLADVAVFSLDHLPSLARQHPHESVVYGGAQLKHLFVGGKQIVNAGELV